MIWESNFPTIWQYVCLFHPFEPPHDKTNKITCAPSEDSDQPGHLPSLIRVFTVCLKKHWVLSCQWSALRRFWSDWVDAQADLSLRWAHMSFCWFVMRRLIWVCQCQPLCLPLQSSSSLTDRKSYTVVKCLWLWPTLTFALAGRHNPIWSFFYFYIL